MMSSKYLLEINLVIVTIIRIYLVQKEHPLLSVQFCHHDLLVRITCHAYNMLCKGCNRFRHIATNLLKNVSKHKLYQDLVIYHIG